MSLPKINLVFVGHKDHGKSTLIGRLLHDSKAIPEQRLQEIKEELKEAEGKEFKFAFLLDSLEEERKGGLTIDIMQTPFKSRRYLYTIIDCPGHKEFIKKMLTGASQADAAVLVVSAKEGIQDQTRQHTFLIKTLGISQLVVAVNKMDAVAYEENQYNSTYNELKRVLISLGYHNAPVIPVSALKGENVFKRSTKMKWYKGATLVETLDKNTSPTTIPLNKPLRGVVQDVYQHEDKKKIVACKIETGFLKPGKMVKFNPSGKEGLLEAIEVFGTTARKAGPGDSVGLILKGVGEVERGEVLSYSEDRLRNIKNFVSEIIIFSDIHIKNDQEIIIRYGTAEKKCKVKKILSEIDPVNLTIHSKFPKSLKNGSVGVVELVSLEPLCVETYSDFPSLGRFIVKGKKGTVAAGIVLEVIEFHESNG